MRDVTADKEAAFPAFVAWSHKLPMERIVERTIGAAAIAGAAYLLLHLVAFEYGRDQGIYAVVANGLLHGDAPYRDVWDFKPPGIFFVFALAQRVFGTSMYAVRILEAAGFASLLWAFAIFSRRHLGSALPGILGGAFAVLAHVQLEFWHTAQPSSFGAIVLAWALVCATYEPTAGMSGRAASRVAWLAAGALYSVAALLKPPLGGGIAVSAAAIAWRRRQLVPPSQRLTAACGPLPFLAAGALLPIVLVLSYLAAVGALREMYDALFIFAPEYTALGLRETSLASLLLQAVGEWVSRFSLVNAIGLVLLLGLPAVGRRGREGALHVAGVVAVVLAGVAVQAKFFPYHYDSALALTGLLAGWGFWKAWRVLGRRPLGAATVGLLAALSIALTLQRATWVDGGESLWHRCGLRVEAWMNPAARDAINQELYATGAMNQVVNQRVASWLRARTAPDASIYVWGFEPVIYFLADRRPASRYVYNVPQRTAWASRESRATLVRELERNRPAALVVEHGDRIPWVTGDNRDSAETLPEFPELKALLDSSYRPAGSIGQFDLYLSSSSYRDHAAS